MRPIAMATLAMIRPSALAFARQITCRRAIPAVARCLCVQATALRRPGTSPQPLLLPLVPRGRRPFGAQALWLPPVMFVGLLGALWVWKCAMMVIFQNKIIYMPGMPPNARRERIADYAARCGGVRWEERRLQAADGTDLALCVARVEATGAASATSSAAASTPVYVLYFQGASCLFARLGVFSG